MYSDVPQQILRQLRWLEAVFNESELAEKLMMVIHECPERLQKELISAVPEIVTDSTHQHVVEELDTIMVENTHMTVPVLDAMSNLTLSNALKVSSNQPTNSSLRNAEYGAERGVGTCSERAERDVDR